jgi:hypothetical protein
MPALHADGSGAVSSRPSTVGILAHSSQPSGHSHSGAATDRTDLDGVEARGRRLQHMRHMLVSREGSVGSNLSG